MGKVSSTAAEKASVVVAGTFTAVGQSNAAEFYRKFNFWMGGPYIAGVVLERSFDGGATWFEIVEPDGVSAGGNMTVSGGNGAAERSSLESSVLDEPEPGILYRLRCHTYTSGTVTYRLSQ